MGSDLGRHGLGPQITLRTDKTLSTSDTEAYETHTSFRVFAGSRVPPAWIQLRESQFSKAKSAAKAYLIP